MAHLPPHRPQELVVVIHGGAGDPGREQRLFLLGLEPDPDGPDRDTSG